MQESDGTAPGSPPQPGDGIAALRSSLLQRAEAIRLPQLRDAFADACAEPEADADLLYLYDRLLFSRTVTVGLRRLWLINLVHHALSQEGVSSQSVDEDGFHAMGTLINDIEYQQNGFFRPDDPENVALIFLWFTGTRERRDLIRSIVEDRRISDSAEIIALVHTAEDIAAPLLSGVL